MTAPGPSPGSGGAKWARRNSARPRLLPVLVRQGVLGARRDLLVSRRHGLVIGGGHLARAVQLSHATPGIRLARGRREVTYIHLMFEAHQVILAEGMPSETSTPAPGPWR